MNLLEQLVYNTSRGPFYEEDVSEPLAVEAKIRLIAYYLPQFHPIKENDEWWGKGFTEWTNVTRAIPRFSGHYQPRLPGSLGFYNLSDASVLYEQAGLAKKYGIYGFCFHHYWFNGRRLLDLPLNILLEHKDIEIPFFVNWANETWSRRWDGSESQVLIQQVHSDEDDLAFAAHLLPLFADRRYIRINGRPMLMIYHPALLPNATRTVERWREFFHRQGEADPYILMPVAFGDSDPRKYGMDAVAGFPPHAHKGPPPSEFATIERSWLPRTCRYFDPAYEGRVATYEKAADTTLAYNPAEYRLLPGVCPNWDNDARRPGKGFALIGSTPKLYGRWLEEACLNAAEAPPDERIVFINAWNEWAEGAYLEPDRHFGYAYLAETARIMRKIASSTAPGSSRRSNQQIVTPFSETVKRQDLENSRRFTPRRMVGRAVHDVEFAIDRLVETVRHRL